MGIKVGVKERKWGPTDGNLTSVRRGLGGGEKKRGGSREKQKCLQQTRCIPANKKGSGKNRQTKREASEKKESHEG